MGGYFNGSGNSCYLLHSQTLLNKREGLAVLKPQLAPGRQQIRDRSFCPLRVVLVRHQVAQETDAAPDREYRGLIRIAKSSRREQPVAETSRALRVFKSPSFAKVVLNWFTWAAKADLAVVLLIWDGQCGQIAHPRAGSVDRRVG